MTRHGAPLEQLAALIRGASEAEAVVSAFGPAEEREARLAALSAAVADSATARAHRFSVATDNTGRFSQAVCSCGWRGFPRATRRNSAAVVAQHAAAEYRAHRNTVRAALSQPVASDSPALAAG